MKIFACLLSIYILVLNAIPCTDGLDSICMQSNKIIQVAKDSPIQNSIDYCSPFCTCNCCTSPIIYQTIIIHLECFSIIEKCTSDYIPINIDKMYIPIWEPPKIV